MNSIDDSELDALGRLTNIFSAMSAEIAIKDSLPRARIDNAMFIAAVSSMVTKVGSAQVADWLRRQATSIEDLDHELTPATLQLLQ